MFAPGFPSKGLATGDFGNKMGPERTIRHGSDITELLSGEGQSGTGVKYPEVLQGGNFPYLLF